MQDQEIFKAFKKLTREKIDRTLAENVQQLRAPILSEAQKITILREAWEEAFSIKHMENSWSMCGFKRHPIHGYICDRSVYWSLKKAEEATLKARRDAGITVGNLDFSVFDFGKPSTSAAAAADDGSSSDDDGDGDGAGPTRKGPRIQSGDFLELGPITLGPGYDKWQAKQNDAKAEKKRKADAKLVRERAKETKLMNMQSNAVFAAKKLVTAKGEIKRLTKADVYALLLGLRVPNVNAQDGLAKVLLPAYEAVCARAAEANPEHPGWMTVCEALWPMALRPVEPPPPAQLTGPEQQAVSE